MDPDSTGRTRQDPVPGGLDISSASSIDQDIYTLVHRDRDGIKVLQAETKLPQNDDIVPYSAFFYHRPSRIQSWRTCCAGPRRNVGVHHNHMGLARCSTNSDCMVYQRSTLQYTENRLAIILIQEIGFFSAFPPTSVNNDWRRSHALPSRPNGNAHGCKHAMLNMKYGANGRLRGLKTLQKGG
jgi:hypothetical protein